MRTSDWRPSSRGASLLAGVVFIAILGVVGFAIQSTLPSADPYALTAATTVSAPASWSDNFPSSGAAPTASIAQPYNSSKAPANCTEAISKAVGKQQDPQVASTDEGQSGTLDACYGAIHKKTATTYTAADYSCVGRSGIVLIANGKITATTDPDLSVAEGVCKISVCNDVVSDKTCAPAKLMNGVKTAQGSPTDPISLADTSGQQGRLPTAPGGANAGDLGNAYDQSSNVACDSASADYNPVACNNAVTNAINTGQTGTFPTLGSTCPVGTYGTPPNCTSANSNTPPTLPDAQTCKDIPALCGSPSTLTPPAGPDSGPAGPAGPAGPGSGGPGNTFPGTPPGAGNPSGGSNPFMSILSGLLKGLLGGGGAGAASTCSTDPAIYAQQQQQYQQALQQYNLQLQQYNLMMANASSGGGPPPQIQPPIPPVPCKPSGSQCRSQPSQPPMSSCTDGSWRPVFKGACLTRWKCSGGSGALTAQLSCEPQLADVGMSVAISYSCSAGTGKGDGFTAGRRSGSATSTITTPPDGTNTATYSLACTNQGKTVGDQCSVEINKPSIILVANPKTVLLGQTSLLGWITTGMRSCVISSPDQSDFTSQNSSNTSVNGTAETAAITGDSSFLLRCVTLAGGTRDATTVITLGTETASSN